MMIKSIKILLCGFFLLTGTAGIYAQPPSWIVPAALRFVSNPDDFFYNLHLDNVDYSPSRPDKRVELRTNFLPTTLPLTWLNLNGKVRMLGDGGLSPWVPQVDLTGAYGRIIMLDILPSLMDDEDDDAPEPSMTNYSLGMTLAKSVSRETSLFAGFHHSVVSLDIVLPESDIIEITDDVTLEELVIRRKDNILITGISNATGENRMITAYLGYGFNYNKIFSRIAWKRKHLEMGFNIYPEGLLVVHPFLGWRWNF